MAATPLESLAARRWPGGDRRDETGGERDPDLGVAARDAMRTVPLLRRWRLVALCTLACVLMGAAFLMMRSQVYIGTTSVLVGTRIASPDGQRAALAAQADINDLRFKVMQLLAQKARLQTEYQGAATIDFPPELTSPPDDARHAEVMDGEQLLFAARRRAEEEDASSLTQLLQLYRDQADGLEKQIQFAAVEQQSVDDELAAVKGLVEKKLAPITRQRDLERAAAAMASRRIEVDTERLSARQKILETQQKLDQLQSAKHADLLDQLHTTEGNLTSAQARLDAATGYKALANVAASVEPAVIENQIELIQSDANLLGLIREKGLQDDASFLFSNDPDTGSSASDEVMASEDFKEQLALYVMQKNLTVDRVGRGSRIDIGFTSSDPQRAAAIADAVAADYAADNSADPASGRPSNTSTSPQILRKASVARDGPGAAQVMIAALFAGLVIGTGLVFLSQFFRALRAQAA